MKELAAQLALLLDRPVQYMESPVGDYDGRERTFKVYRTAPLEQRDIYRRYRAWKSRSSFEQLAGGPIILICVRGEP